MGVALYRLNKTYQDFHLTTQRSKDEAHHSGSFRGCGCLRCRSINNKTTQTSSNSSSNKTNRSSNQTNTTTNKTNTTTNKTNTTTNRINRNRINRKTNRINKFNNQSAINRTHSRQWNINHL